MLNKEADVMEVMTLNEAIQHCEEVAKENREYAEDALDRYNLVPSEITKQEHDRCKQCAAEYRQLAEWLKDYKRLRKITFQPKMGKWITKSHGFPPEPTTVCSECGFDRDFYIRIRGFDKINYCPSCGARFERREDEE